MKIFSPSFPEMSHPSQDPQIFANSVCGFLTILTTLWTWVVIREEFVMYLLIKVLTKAALSSLRTRPELHLVTSHAEIRCQLSRRKAEPILIQNIEAFRYWITWNEVEFVDSVYNPSLRLRFFCFPSSSIPKAKELKLIQLTSRRPPGEWGLLGSIFAGYVPLASQNPYPL